MWNAWLDEAQAGIKILRRNINNLRYANDTTLTAERKEELKSFLMKVKEESEKASLKNQHSETKVMAYGPITSWQIDGKTIQWKTLFCWAPKSLWTVTAAVKLKDVCSLGGKKKKKKKSYDKPRQHIQKERHNFSNKCLYSQSYGFSSSHAWMWELENKKKSWVPKNWSLSSAVLKKRLFRVPWTTRRSY